MLGLCAGLALVLVITGGAVLILRTAGPTAAPPVTGSTPSPVRASPVSASPTTTSPTPPAPTPSLPLPATAAPLPATPSPSPTPPLPRIGPSGPAASSPATRPTPRGPDRSLRTNAAYDIDLGERQVSCDLRVRDPRPPLDDDDLAPYLRDVVDCLVQVFTDPLAAEGFVLSTPKVKTYAKSIKTPCGNYGQNKAPAFYCSATQTIYWASTSDDGRQAYTFTRLGYVGLTAHEFGHHLQATTGMLAEYGTDYYTAKKTSDRNLLSRRLELQAQCFEGVFLNQTAEDLRLSTSDRAQLRTWHSYTGDEDPPSDRVPDHGSSAAQIRWLERGLDSADLSRCNTWKASASGVK